MTDPHRHDHHDHDHDHDHAPDDPAPPRAFELLEQAIRELLIEKGQLTAEQLQRQIDDMDSRTPMNGIRLVAKAWTDPAFKARLLAEPTTVIPEWGIDLDTSTEPKILANTRSEERRDGKRG